jgi:hypothetical protein
VVDPSLPCVGGGTAGRVEEDCGEADRGQRLRGVVRIEQEQDRSEDEAAAGADQRSERADAEPDQDEQAGSLG